jgi:hypothetical protein
MIERYDFGRQRMDVSLSAEFSVHFVKIVNCHLNISPRLKEIQLKLEFEFFVLATKSHCLIMADET